MYQKAVKVLAVSFGAILLTTLFIDAADTLTGNGTSMLAQLMGVEQPVCPIGMIHIPAALTFSCVDEYEAVASSDCPIDVPGSQLDTETNLKEDNCVADSKGDLEPWRFVTREQAVVLCTRAGKRLPSAAEWYHSALGTNAKVCNVESGGAVTGDVFAKCTSAAGIKNTVGNVWEWVADDVIDGVYQGRSLPITGYVAQVDIGGVATLTKEDLGEDMRGGYFWAKSEGSFGIIRGGFYGSRTDASPYTMHTYTLPTFRGAAVGFRCVK